MVKLRKNILIKGLIGAVNKQLVFKQYGKTTVISSYPDMSRVVKTEKQKKENLRFAKAVAYAKSQMANPVFKAEYEAKAKDGRRAYNLAIADFYNSPEIKKVDTSRWKGSVGDIICIEATDDFRVENVRVEIFDSYGQLLETASARKLTAIKWECSPQEYNNPTNIHIKVSACDRPGNIAIWEGVLF